MQYNGGSTRKSIAGMTTTSLHIFIKSLITNVGECLIVGCVTHAILVCVICCTVISTIYLFSGLPITTYLHVLCMTLGRTLSII